MCGGQEPEDLIHITQELLDMQNVDWTPDLRDENLHFT